MDGKNSGRFVNFIIKHIKFIIFIFLVTIISIFLFKPVDYFYLKRGNFDISNSSKNEMGIFKVVDLDQSNNYEIGFAHGRLLKDEIKIMIDEMNTILKSEGQDDFLAKIKLRVLMKFYNLKTPKKYKEEIEGISRATNISYEDLFLLNVYDDIFNTAMCTNIAALNEKTINNNIIHGRNLDYNLQEYTWDKAVIFNYNQEGKIPFVSIGYPGMIGTLTSMNSNGLTLGSMTSQIKSNNYFGIPTGFLYRSIIENSDTISKSEKILKNNKTTIGNNLMITSKKDKLAVVFEITPKVIEKRVSDMSITAANHFEILSDKNKYNSRSSVYRADWSEELLNIIDKIDSNYIIEILRDPQVKESYGEPIANNRNVISVVFLPYEQEFLVASNEVVPASQGRFFHFNFKNNEIKFIGVEDPGVEFLNFKHHNFEKNYDKDSSENIMHYANIFLNSKNAYKPYLYSSTIEYLLKNEIAQDVDKYIFYLYKYIESGDSINFDNNKFDKNLLLYFNKHNTEKSLSDFYVQKNSFYFSWYEYVKNGKKQLLNDIINNVNYYEWLRKWADNILNGGV